MDRHEIIVALHKLDWGAAADSLARGELSAPDLITALDQIITDFELRGENPPERQQIEAVRQGLAALPDIPSEQARSLPETPDEQHDGSE